MSCLRVKTAGRFIQKQELRTMDDDLPDTDTLFLTTGKVADFGIQFMFQIKQANGFQQQIRKSRIRNTAGFGGIS